MASCTETTGRRWFTRTGRSSWYRDGRRHRDGAPACVYLNGTEKWYRDGLRHGDPGEGPAATYPDGRRIWFVDGVQVRRKTGGGGPP